MLYLLEAKSCQFFNGLKFSLVIGVLQLSDRSAVCDLDGLTVVTVLKQLNYLFTFERSPLHMYGSARIPNRNSQ